MITITRPAIILFMLLSYSCPVHAENKTRWTPFQLSLVNPVQVFNARRDVYGLRLDLIYGRNGSVFGLDIGCYNDSKNMAGFQAGILNETVSPGDENRRGMSLVYGIQLAAAGNFSGSIDCRARIAGFQIAFLFNSTTIDSFAGVQLAGVYNMASEGAFRGMQFSGILNSSDSLFSGIQFACGGNHSGSIKGIQFAIIGNYGGQVRGIQGSGIFNAVLDADACGIQFSGLVNFSEKGIYGIQAAPVFNGIEEGAIHGLQLGVLCNEAYSGEVLGMQFGFINIAHNMKGIQIGVINLAQKMSGVQIGVFNIIIEGRLPFFPIFNASFSY